MSEQNIRQLLDGVIKYSSMVNNINTVQYECLIRFFKSSPADWTNFVKLLDLGKQATVIKLLLSENGICGRVSPQPAPQPAPQPFAFACSPGLGCHRVNESPNKGKGLFSDIQSCNALCAKPAPSIHTLPDDLVGVGGRGLMGLGFGTPGFEDRTITDQNLMNRYKAPGKGSCANFPSPYPAVTDAPIWESYINEPSCKIMDYRTTEDKKMLLKYNNMAVSSYNSAYPSLNARPSWENFRF